MTIVSRVEQQLSVEPLLSAKKIVVAYSGGVDSHVLLHLLHGISLRSPGRFELSAVHIHHGLNQQADNWQNHCGKVCAQLSVDFKSARIELQKTPRQSLEANARKARYEKISELVPHNALVILGQHQQDQLETFLLQLKRGAGPTGLSAMAQSWTIPCAAKKSVAFCRPLLTASQQDILLYAQQHKLHWCEDDSNLNTDFDRNFLRHKVLPNMQQRWPQLAQTVARSAQLCAEQQTLLNEVCGEKLTAVRASQNSLYLPGLLALSAQWMQQVVRFWLRGLAIDCPSMAILAQLESQVLAAKSDANPILQWQNWQFRRFAQQLYVITIPEAVPTQSIAWSVTDPLILPAKLGWLECSQAPESNEMTMQFDPTLGPLQVRFGGFSLRFAPSGRPHSKPLKQWFKEWQLAPWLRSQVVILVQQEKVIGVLVEGQWIVAQPITNNPACVITHRAFTA